MAGSLTLLGAAALGLGLLAQPVVSQGATERARQELGFALFNETEFVNPGADFAPSCNTCHFRGPDPRGSGDRFFSDTSARSLLPGLGGVSRGTTLRNAPMLLELGLQERFGWNGRWTSLDEVVLWELTSEHFGWRQQDRERALDAIAQVAVDRAMVDYPQLFQRARFVDVDSLDRDALVSLVVTSLSEYLREILSSQTSLWDAFSELNRIPSRPGRGESPKEFAGRVYGRLSNQEGRVLIKRPVGFSAAAYEGFKAFFRVEGEASVGNCVSCHTPPLFRDSRLHDTGIASREPGSGDEAGPAAPESSTAFKTPSLRNLPRTGPYMHNGNYAGLEDVVREYMQISSLVRAGELAGADPELAVMKLDEGDIAPIAAFLAALDEVDEMGFRRMITEIEAEEH